MDKFGYLENTYEDAGDVRDLLDVVGTAIFTLAADKDISYSLLLVGKPKRLGTVRWRGGFDDHYFVSMLDHGTFHFDPSKPLVPGPFAEKIGCSMDAARDITIFLSKVFK